MINTNESITGHKPNENQHDQRPENERQIQPVPSPVQHGEVKESVLAVLRSTIDPLCPRVFNYSGESVKAAVLASGQFLERTQAEHDFRYKQIIPYVVIRHQNSYLLTRRTAKQTESRLHNLYSLGVGGHVNDLDVSQDGRDVLTSGMRRELEEEIHVESEQSCRLAGVINDDSTEVARVHLGFVYVLTLASPQYRIMEPDKYTAAWKTPRELSEHYDQMESWAKIVHDCVVFAGSPEHAKKWEMQTELR